MIVASLIGREALVRKFLLMGPATQRELYKSVASLVFKLQAKVKRDRLSGQVLKVRTGTLRRSIYGKVEQASTFMFGIVGTNVKYAAAHEYGFKGQVSVKQHLRTIKNNRPGRPNRILVMSFSRNVHLPERSFLRTSLAEMEPEIRATLQRVVNSTLKGIL